MKKCVILIPVWKYELYDYEIISLQRTISLYQHSDIADIMFLIPKIFDIYNLLNTNNIKYDKDSIFYCYVFDEEFFKSSITYNKIMLNYDTYSNLIDKYEYEYMLIVQTDAYIFNEQLEYWINKNYNYIGSYEGIIKNYYINEVFDISHYTIDNKFPLIHMNGGFSLRKMQYCIDILKNIGILSDYIFQSNFATYGEDLIYSIYTNNQISALDSIKFGYSHIFFYDSYAINNYQLPFGAHAIHRNIDLLNFVKEFNNNLKN